MAVAGGDIPCMRGPCQGHYRALCACCVGHVQRRKQLITGQPVFATKQVSRHLRLNAALVGTGMHDEWMGRCTCACMVAVKHPPSRSTADNRSHAHPTNVFRSACAARCTRCHYERGWGAGSGSGGSTRVDDEWKARTHACTRQRQVHACMPSAANSGAERHVSDNPRPCKPKPVSA